MSVNMVLLNGTVERLALRYGTDGKPELRFSLTHHKGEWPLYVPCCAVGATAERLASELDEGDGILIASGQLCYRKRATKGGGEQSRLEILVWAVDVLTKSAHDERSDRGEYHPSDASEIVAPVGDFQNAPAKVRTHRQKYAGMER